MFRVCLIGISLLFLTSCSLLLSDVDREQTVSSSLVDFLYPNKQDKTVIQPTIPTLHLPVNVGIAFVPSANRHQTGIHPATQTELLSKVKAAFDDYDFINRIEIIPETYLKRGKGFDTLAQVSRLYNVDIMALVSYDQLAQSSENNAALLYWTIVGMYVIPGNSNLIQTFVDTAVFDINSRSLLFRAPGVSKLENRSTAVGVSSSLSEQSLKGFELAVADMTTNLNNELSHFKTRIKEEKIANITHRDGYSGGAWPIWALCLLSAIAFCKRETRKSVNSK